MEFDTYGFDWDFVGGFNVQMVIQLHVLCAIEPWGANDPNGRPCVSLVDCELAVVTQTSILCSRD